MKPAIVAGLLALLSGGCAGVDYYDTNAEVDTRPECTGMGHERAGEPIPPWCVREQGARRSSDEDRMELELGDEDDDER